MDRLADMPPCRTCGRAMRDLEVPRGLERFYTRYVICPSCGHRTVRFTLDIQLWPDSQRNIYSVFSRLQVAFPR